MIKLLTDDTIAAIATAPGKGGVGIVRLSGVLAKSIGEQLCRKALAPRLAVFAKFQLPAGPLLDSGVALYFQGPHSFTGEDVVELQGHGSPITLDRLLAATLSLGARMAGPGEFSQRAFLNNKIDLAQAEAIAALIDSQSEQAARAALRSLEGDFSRAIEQCVQRIIHTRMYVEAAIDFPEEEIDFLSDGKVLALVDELIAQLTDIQRRAHQGSLLQEGLTLVIAGKPNAGKSSLLNGLSGKDSAIVTPIAGTTRDINKESIQIDGLALHLIDTAGLRDSLDPVEQEGIRRTKLALQKADRVLLMVDVQQCDAAAIEQQWQETRALLPQAIPCTLVLNKIDLITSATLDTLLASIKPLADTTLVPLSAASGQLDALRQHLKASIAYDSNLEGCFSARRRHLHALERAQMAVHQAKEQLLVYRAGELVAEELTQAQHALNEITGEFSADDLLGEIFGSFCIGK